ncbi:MAG: methylamine utilization protein MauE [Planctomycetota bacterium]|nr:methylamine utilization protein MauE [Planctomycetota bacterium]
MRFNRIFRKLFSGFSFIVRLGLGCLFLWSSLPKIRQPYDFLSSVYNYELVGPKLGALTAMTLPWLELLVGVCLVGGIFVSGALLASIGMAAMFTFVLASALYRGLEISCGCFSASDAGVIGYSTLIRACVILLFSAVAYTCMVFLQRSTEYKHKDSNRTASQIAGL